MLTKSELEKLYLEDKMSIVEVSNALGCSPHKVEYWMVKHQIKRRTISEAVYTRNHPKGDPFTVKLIKTKKDSELLGMGLGLYWGEGTKTSLHSVRLGNTDPALLRMFMRFLIELFGVDKDDMKFSLQIFTDIDPTEALNFWAKELAVHPWQFGKIIVTISGSLGTYRKKSKYGVVTVHYHNTKLRDVIVNMLPR